MATEQDTHPTPWQQLLQQQQLQQAPQSEPADLVTYHESDPRPGEEGYEEEEAPNIRSEPEPRQNAVVEGDDADLEEKQEEEVLQRRLEGSAPLDAVLDACEKFGINESSVQDIWRNHKRLALDLEAVHRRLEAHDKRRRWTEEEKKRLKEIYDVHRWGDTDTPDG